MSPVPDRKKQRREYLKQKSHAYSHVAIYGLLTLPTLLIGIGSGLFTFYFVNEHASPDFGAILGCIGTSVVFVSLSGHFWRRYEVYNQVADSLAYVPPVTPSTLPVEEVLVRGAAQPAAPSEALLRAVHAHEDPAPGQLLRAAGGAPEKPAAS